MIPKDVRNFLGIKAGQKVIFQIKDKEVLLKLQDSTSFLDSFLNISKRLENGIRIKDIKEIMDEQYELH